MAKYRNAGSETTKGQHPNACLVLAERYNRDMTRQLEVVYDAGVLRPLAPLPFADKQRLLATITDNLDAERPYNTRERERVSNHLKT